MSQKFPSAKSTKKQPSSKSSSDNWSIAIYKILSSKKSRFGDGVTYLVNNIDPKSKYRGTKTGLDRTQIQRVDPTTAPASGRTIADEDKHLNKVAEVTPPSETGPPPQQEDVDDTPPPSAPPKANNLSSGSDWTRALKDVEYKDTRKSLRSRGYISDTQVKI